MKFWKVILFVLFAVSVQAQFVPSQQIENYTANWHFLYCDSMQATTAVDTLVLPSGFLYNIVLTARGSNVVFKTTKATAYQPHWIPLLVNESYSYTGTASVDSIFFKASTTTCALIAQWTKF
jgi:hypothetical protein